MFFSVLKSSVLLPLALIASVAGAPQTVKRQVTGAVTRPSDDARGSLNAPSYSGGWTHLTNQGPGYYDGTESYTDNSYGFYLIDWPEAPNAIDRLFNIEVRAGKKNDRGAFELHFDNSTQTTLGFGNAYAPAETVYGSEVVYSRDGFHVPVPSDAEGPVVLKVNNNPEGDQRFLAVDKVTISWSETY